MRHEESENYGKGGGSWLLAFVLGGLVGAAVALLTAPKSGRQTREQIRGVAHDARERAEDYYDQMKGRISDTMQKGAHIFQQKKEQMKSTVESAKEAYQKAKTSASE